MPVDASDQTLRFIDLFAGIGGIRVAMEAAGGRCVMTSEWDRWAKNTYEAFFGPDEHFVGDIQEINPEDVPAHDVLCAGFPCQPFSLAGVSKKNSLGRPHGFSDPTQGTLFFNIKVILAAKQPSGFLLENVKHLRRHDKGRTWRVISEALHECGYEFSSKVIDASAVVPQHRERVFIAGIRRDLFAKKSRTNRDWTGFWHQVEDALEGERTRMASRFGVTLDDWPKVGGILEEEASSRYTLTPKLWQYLQNYRKKHEAKGNGFGFGIVDGESRRTRTLSARYYKDGSEALVNRGADQIPRRLTPLECLRLQGFPEEFEAWFDGSREQPVSDTQAYKQFGNSVAVPVVRAIAGTLTSYLCNPALRAAMPLRFDAQVKLDFDTRRQNRTELASNA